MSAPVGIERISVYPTTLALDMDDLASARDLDLGFVKNDLGVRQRGVNPPWEDPVTMAVNAARPIVAAIDADSIGLLIVGTESGVDQEKPISSWVHRYLGLAPHCRNFEVKHACYGTTGAAALALTWLASGVAGDRKALVINTDQSILSIGQPYEPVTGAAAAAVLLSRSPRLVQYELERSGVYSFEISDVFRPTPKLEMGNSETSLFSYLEALDGAYRNFLEAAPAPLDFDDHFDWHVYHMPFPGMALRAHRALLASCTGLSKAEATAHFARKCAPSTTFARRMGGMYGASTLIGLLGLVDGMESPTPGARIGVFAYGSGSCGEFYTVQLLEEAASVVQEAALGATLDSRRRLDVATYETIERQRHEAIMAPDYAPGLNACGDWYAQRYEGQGMLVLDAVEHHYRHYRWS